MVRKTKIMDRIVENIEVCEDTNCWMWKGATSGTPESKKTGRGYGRISIDGTTMAVHRVVYTHFHGIIPHKKQIDHICRNRLCCNPEHLEMVTHKENTKRRDMK